MFVVRHWSAGVGKRVATARLFTSSDFLRSHAETQVELPVPSQRTPHSGTHTGRKPMRARKRQMSLFAVVAVALVVVLSGTALAQSSNSEVGTWKLNVAKSKFSLGT